MASIDDVLAIAGWGLKGDRYAEGKGAYSRSRVPKIRHVTLIGREAISEANLELDQPFRDVNDLMFITRRNLVTEGVDLEALIGERFTVGAVSMRGVEICEPCKRPERLAPDAAGFEAAFQGRGGIRAEILGGGMIDIGDPIR